jgi:WD40 repeat protein
MPAVNRLVTVGDGTNAWIWNISTGTPAIGPMPHQSLVWSANFSPDGRWVATFVANEVRVWDAKSGQLIARLPNEKIDRIPQFSPDGQRLVTGGFHSARVWDVCTGLAVTPFPLPTRAEFRQVHILAGWPAGGYRV